MGGGAGGGWGGTELRALKESLKGDVQVTTVNRIRTVMSHLWALVRLHGQWLSAYLVLNQANHLDVLPSLLELSAGGPKCLPTSISETLCPVVLVASSGVLFVLIKIW